MMPHCQVVLYAFFQINEETNCLLPLCKGISDISFKTHQVVDCFAMSHWLLSNIPDYSMYQMKQVLIMSSEPCIGCWSMTWVSDLVGQYGPCLVSRLASRQLLSADEGKQQRSIFCLGSFSGSSMCQQIIVDPVMSRCTWFSLHD